MTRALLLDEMLSPRIAEQIRGRGHDVCAIAERGDLIGQSDRQVLTVGAAEGRVVVTLNIADFAALHADWQAQGLVHSGLVYVSTTSLPQDRAFLGAMVVSLDTAARSDRLPGANETCFLHRT